MIYKEAVKYIRNIERAGIDLGLERVRELLDMLGAPDEGLRCVHIAGTNGKGSVSAYLTSILREAGYRVGTYNSPSVFCYNERWLIDGAPLSDEAVAKYMSEVARVIEDENARRNFRPTAFEIETAVAFTAFKAEGCDVCVIETGMGGRWDATNAIRHKLLSVITPIGLDHCAYLGDTLGEIAAEKAAIIDGDAVTCAQSDDIMSELAHPWRTVDGVKTYMPCSLFVAGEATPVDDSLKGQHFLYEGKKYFVKMLGAHQLQNAAIAICAAKKLDENGIAIGEDSIKRGLEKTVWHGRFEIVQNAKERFYLDVPAGKTLVFDGAHNPHGAKTLRDALQKYFAGARIHLVIGVLKDKDVRGIAGLIAPLATRATCVTVPSPRAMSAEELARIVGEYVPCDIGGSIHGSVQAALDGDCDVVLVAGSLTLFEDMGGKAEQ